MRQRLVRLVIVVLVGFCAGALSDAWLTIRRRPATAIGTVERGRRAPGTIGTSGGGVLAPGTTRERAVETLRTHALRLPVEAADVDRWKGSFDEVHSGHRHEAVDILAPRGTPVHAVDGGVIGKLFTSKAGGLTVYQYDPSREFVYYYAHLDGYAPGLQEGQAVEAGQVLGFVGTTGNAPPDTPHLHFAIAQLAPGEGWWQGTPINPYLVFRQP